MKKSSPYPLLKANGVDMKNWGKNNFSRTVHHLRKEIATRECRLEARGKGTVIRISRAVKVAIYHRINGENHILVEEKQVFRNGTVRSRAVPGKHCLPAEKLFLKERSKSGLQRLLKEELSMHSPKLLKDCVFLEAVLEKEESRSYPGLTSERTMYLYEVQLPPNLYKDTYMEEQEDKKTYFSWQKL